MIGLPFINLKTQKILVFSNDLALIEKDPKVPEAANRVLSSSTTVNLIPTEGRWKALVEIGQKEYLELVRRQEVIQSQKKIKKDGGRQERNFCSSSEVLDTADKVKRCAKCLTSQTPLWRRGPGGPKTLCNACGIKYARDGYIYK